MGKFNKTLGSIHHESIDYLKDRLNRALGRGPLGDHRPFLTLVFLMDYIKVI